MYYTTETPQPLKGGGSWRNMLRPSFVPRVFLAPRTVEQPPHGSGFPVLPSRRSARRATSDGLIVHHFLRASPWFACRTVGFIDFTPTLSPGTEILWMRLFDQRSDIGMGVMPTQLVTSPHQIPVAGPATVRAAEQPARRMVAIFALGARRACAAFLVPFDLDPSFGLVFNHAGLLAIFPKSIALPLRFASPGFGNAGGLAEDHFALASLDAPIHHLTRNLVVDIPDLAHRLRLLAGHRPLGLLLTPGSGSPARLERLLMGTFLLPADLLRHDGPTVDHQAFPIARENGPGPALPRIPRSYDGFPRRVRFSPGRGRLDRDQHFVEAQFRFEDPSGVLPKRDRKWRRTIPAAQGELPAHPRHQVATKDHRGIALLILPWVTGLPSQLAARLGGFDIPKELPYRLLHTGGRQPNVAVLAPDKVCVESRLPGPLPMRLADALMDTDHIIPQHRH